MRDTIQIIITLLGGLFAYLFGELDAFLYALIIFIVIDYITGLMIAFNNKKLSSSVGFKGITKKCTMLLMVIVANIIDKNILQDGNVIRTAVIFFYLSNEGISIIENASALGVPVPKKLLKVLEQINDDEVLENTESEGN